MSFVHAVVYVGLLQFKSNVTFFINIIHSFLLYKRDIKLCKSVFGNTLINSEIFAPKRETHTQSVIQIQKNFRV